MKMFDKVVELLKEKHGGELDLKNKAYYLFLKDGLFSLYYDEDEKTVKVHVEFAEEDSTFVYFSDQKLEDLLQKKKVGYSIMTNKLKYY